MSLYRTPLGEILPTEPTGNVDEEGFKPQLTDLGRRHPVTADLPGAGEPGDAAGLGPLVPPGRGACPSRRRRS